MSDFKGWLTATVKCRVSLAGTPNNVPHLAGEPKLNETEVLDTFDYFKTEDNKHFLVTEAGDHLGFY